MLVVCFIQLIYLTYLFDSFIYTHCWLACQSGSATQRSDFYLKRSFLIFNCYELWKALFLHTVLHCLTYEKRLSRTIQIFLILLKVTRILWQVSRRLISSSTSLVLSDLLQYFHYLSPQLHVKRSAKHPLFAQFFTLCTTVTSHNSSLWHTPTYTQVFNQTACVVSLEQSISPPQLLWAPWTHCPYTNLWSLIPHSLTLYCIWVHYSTTHHSSIHHHCIITAPLLSMLHPFSRPLPSAISNELPPTLRPILSPMTHTSRSADQNELLWSGALLTNTKAASACDVELELGIILRTWRYHKI